MEGLSLRFLASDFSATLGFAADSLEGVPAVLELIVAFSLASFPLSPQGPIVETDDAGVKSWGTTYYPPDARLIVGDTLVYLEAGQTWSCLRNNQPLELAFTGAGGVRFKLALSVHPGGTNWLVATHNRALRALRVDCATSPQPVDLPGTVDYFVPFETIEFATVDRDGQVIAATNERLIRFDPVQGMPTVLHTIAALKQVLLTPAELANPAPHTLKVSDLLATPQGDTWLLVEWLAATQRDVLFLVRRDGSGGLTMVLREENGADEPPTVFRPRGAVSARKAMFYDPRRELVALQGELNYPTVDVAGAWLQSLVVFPAAGPVRFSRLAMGLFPQLVPSTGEGLWVHTLSPEGFGPPGTQFQVPLQWGPVRFDLDTDLDGDGLSFARERSLGTDDLLLDSDGDRVWDHLEVSRFGTDPADAGSAPARATVSITGFAFSSRLSEWPEFLNPGLPFGGIAPDLAAGRAYCRGVESTTCTVGCTGFEAYDCFGPTGARVHTAPLKRFPSFAPGVSEWWLGDETGLELGTATGVQRVATIDDCNARRCGVVSAVATGLAYGPGPVISNVGLDLRRYTREGSSSVCVPEGCAPRLLGQHESRGEIFVAKTLGHRERVYAVAADGGSTFLFDSSFFRAPAVSSLWTDPRTGSSAMALGGAADRLVVLDDALVHVGTATLPLVPSEPWFRTGFGHKATNAFMHAPYLGGSGSTSCPLYTPPEVCSPPPLAKRLPWPAFTDVFGELVPVDSRARPGDVLFWVSALQNAATGYGVEAGARGGLWLHRESGATDQWASPEQLASVADAAARASLASSPFGAARQVSVSPSAATLCFTDFTGRLFTVSIVEGRPAAVVLVQAADAHGCAFAEDDTLAILEKDSIVIGARRFSVASVGDTTGESLHRAGTGWIARMTQGSPSSARVEARCFDGSGAPRGEVLHVAALTVEDGLVYWLERLDTLSGTTSAPASQQGRAFTATIEDFCAGRFTETWWVKNEREAQNLWADLFKGVIDPTEPFQVLHGALARRPDGLLFVSSRGVDSKERGGPDARGKFLFEFPYRVLPAFHPVNGELVKHEAWRRKTGRFSLVHPWPAFVTALALVPGAVPAAWGEAGRAECLGSSCAPYVVGPAPVDAGVQALPDAGTTTPSPPGSMMGCGCRAVDPAALGLSLLLLTMHPRGARRRRSAFRDTGRLR